MSNEVMDFYNNDSNRPFEMSFGQNGKTVGAMRFNGDVMTFEGNADPSASVFIDMIVKKQSAQWEEATSRISELEAKCAALAAENASIKFYLRNGPVILKGGELAAAHQFAPKTPATDAFLAEVQAQESKRVYESILDNPAVTDMESLVDWIEQNANDSLAFAAKLRQEAAQ